MPHCKADKLARLAVSILSVALAMMVVTTVTGCSDGPPQAIDNDNTDDGDNGDDNGDDLEPTPVDDACPDDQTLCSDECVDLDSDPRHCSECAESCPEGHLCEDGQCISHDGDCPATPCSGFTYCEGETGLCLPGCRDDGDCLGGRTCGDDHQCHCPGEQRSCGGVCFAPDDPDACGAECLDCPTGAGTGTAQCVDGDCQLECDDDQRACDRRCVDCPDGATETVCDGDQCIADDCPEGQRVCDGECVDCPATASQTDCEDGQCIATACQESDQRACGGDCVDCPDSADDTDCDGDQCIATSCVFDDRLACGGECVQCPDGADGTDCDGDQCIATSCSDDDLRACGGDCVDCPDAADDTGCDGDQCIATSCSDDDQHACDGDCVDCPDGAGDTDCDNGQCIALTCPDDGLHACDGDCVDCPDGADDTDCDNGQCIATSCSDDDQLACDGDCVDCPDELGDQVCEAGQCAIEPCDDGTFECPEYGCCTWNYEELSDTSTYRLSPVTTGGGEPEAAVIVEGPDYSTQPALLTDIDGQVDIDIIDTYQGDRHTAMLAASLSDLYLFRNSLSATEIHFIEDDGTWGRDARAVDGDVYGMAPGFKDDSTPFVIQAAEDEDDEDEYRLVIATRDDDGGWSADWPIDEVIDEAVEYTDFGEAVVDDDGHIHFVFIAELEDQDEDQVLYGTDASGSWETESVGSISIPSDLTPRHRQNASLALEDDSTPLVAYISHGDSWDDDDELVVARQDGSGWTETQISTDDSLGDVSLRFDAHRPHLTYWDDDYELHHARRVDDTWYSGSVSGMTSGSVGDGTGPATSLYFHDDSLEAVSLVSGTLYHLTPEPAD